MRAVIIKDGVVVNATNTETLVHPDGLTMVYSATAGIGWTYADGVFTEPVIDPSVIQEQNKAACKAFILSKYSEETQRNAALGIYGETVKSEIADHIARIILEENRVFDTLEAPVWPEV